MKLIHGFRLMRNKNSPRKEKVINQWLLSNLLSEVRPLNPFYMATPVMQSTAKGRSELV